MEINAYNTEGFTTIWYGNHVIVVDDSSGDTIRIAKDEFNAENGKKMFGDFIDAHKKPTEPNFEVGDYVFLANANEAYTKLYAFFERYPHLKLYYQYASVPDFSMGLVKMKVANSYEENSHNKYICAVEDNLGRVWLIGDTGLKKVEYDD